MKVLGKLEDYSEVMFKFFLILVDVMVIGYYVVCVVDVKLGDMVVVMGDGVVGLSVIIVVKLCGVKWIILIFCYDDCCELVVEFGVIDNVVECGDEVVEKIFVMINGGVDVVFECVGIV